MIQTRFTALFCPLALHRLQPSFPYLYADVLSMVHAQPTAATSRISKPVFGAIYVCLALQSSQPRSN
jgi:hypothetical protein